MKEMINIKNIGISVFGGLFIAGILKLGVVFGIVMMLCLFLLIPGILRNIQKEKMEYKRFTDACVYLEQMEGAYRQRGKIYQSLKDTEKLFKDGDMKDTLQRALREIEIEYTKPDASKRALDIISEEYGCEQMELFHDFLIRNETRGGDYEKSIQILEKRRNAWISITEQCRSEKKNMMVSVILSMITLFLTPEILLFFLPKEMNIMTQMAERGLVVLNFVLIFLLFRRVMKKNAVNWLTEVEERDEKEILKDYEYIKNYDERKEIVSSIKWAVIPMCITVVCYAFTRSLVCFAIGIPITVLMLNQHKLEYSQRKKQIEKEVERDYPKWLFEITLLMETESVQGAIYKSMENAPKILQYPLKEFSETLQMKPADPDAYFEFLEIYDLPKVHESMKILYSISKGLGGNQEEQILQIIDKNNEMTIQSEKIKNNNKIAGIMVYMLYPVIPSGMKMMADLGLILLTTYGNIGTGL